MQRASNKSINAICERLNKALGRPLTYCDKQQGADFKSNIGHIHHWSTGSGHNLASVCTETGGISIIMYANTRRELLANAEAYLKGIYEGKALTEHGQ